MTALSDFAAKQNAHNIKVSLDLDSLSAGIADLNAKISALQNSSGTITAEDQALLDAVEASGAALETKADALAGVVAAPPVPPA